MYRTITTMGLRDDLADILSRVRHAHERVIVTRSGKPVAAIIPVDELKALQALEDQLDIKAADEAMKHGVFHDLEDVLAELGVE
ncbi:MAG: type II toxin-antitoxin system Phd/YefM family antitoxin [Rhodothermia bacterium]